MRLCAILLALLLMVSGTSLVAQHEHHTQPAAPQTNTISDEAENIGWVPREILSRPLPLRPGIGLAHEKVTTTSKDAQAYYDQGMAYLHSYVWIEAARSFNQATRLDPKMAMGYIGLSRACSGLTDPKAAREAVQKAQALKKGVTPWERVRIDLRAQQLDAIDDIDNQAKVAAYRRAIDAELAKRPKDVELLLIRGNAEENYASGRGQRSLATAVPFYDRVVAISPENAAAHHYLIHTYEGMGNPEEAVKHGEVYARVTPNVAHAQHMYGHDLQKVDRNEEAIKQFEKAQRIEEAYYRDEKIDRRYDWHHIHNLDLMSISKAFLGQMVDAEALWRQGFAAEPTSSMWEAYQAKWPEFLLERARPQEALAAAQKLSNGKWALGRTMGHLLAGRALLRLNQPEKANEELTLAEEQMKQIEDVNPEPLLPHPRYMPEFQKGLLKAEIAFRSGDTQAEQSLRDIVAKAKQGFRNADATSGIFLIQLIASDARAAQKWNLARFAAEQMIKFDAGYAGGHYELALVEEHEGNATAAAAGFKKAVELWHDADPDLAELDDAEGRLAKLERVAQN
jgi:tetratricopeptide (TPR) repeat protein